eukprot:7856164-Pyramimonas_sp.AAC.3
MNETRNSLAAFPLGNKQVGLQRTVERAVDGTLVMTPRASTTVSVYPTLPVVKCAVRMSKA